MGSQHPGGTYICATSLRIALHALSFALRMDKITVEPSSFLTLNGHGAFTPLKSIYLLSQSGSSVNHLLAHHSVHLIQPYKAICYIGLSWLIVFDNRIGKKIDNKMNRIE